MLYCFWTAFPCKYGAVVPSIPHSAKKIWCSWMWRSRPHDAFWVSLRQPCAVFLSCTVQEVALWPLFDSSGDPKKNAWLKWSFFCRQSINLCVFVWGFWRKNMMQMCVRYVQCQWILDIVYRMYITIFIYLCYIKNVLAKRILYYIIFMVLKLICYLYIHTVYQKLQDFRPGFWVWYFFWLIRLSNDTKSPGSDKTNAHTIHVCLYSYIYLP